MSDGKPTSYSEIVTLLGDLPMLVREKRRRNGLSLREAARQVGVSFSTLDCGEWTIREGDPLYLVDEITGDREDLWAGTCCVGDRR